MKDGKVVIGQIGYGYWGPNLLRNYTQCLGAQVKYLCDRSPEQLDKARLRYPSVCMTTDSEELFKDPEVDAIVVATPISTHFELAKRALLAGKHVFVEKPLTSNIKESETLINIAQDLGLVLMVGHTFEYSSPVVKIKELISAGELGQIYYISSSRVNLGLHQSDVSVIWDLAPHDFSMLFYWLNEEPQQVSVFGRACIQPGIPDIAFISLRFGSGVVAQVQLSWLAPVKLRRTVIVGDKKMLLYDDTENVEKIKLFDHGVSIRDADSFGEYQLSYRTGDIVSPHLDNREPLFVEAEHFLECIKTGKRPRTDGYSGLRVVRALEKAEHSLINHRALVEEIGGNGNGNGNGKKTKLLHKF